MRSGRWERASPIEDLLNQEQIHRRIPRRCQTSSPTSATRATTYSYDLSDRPTQAAALVTATYRYDPDGNLIYRAAAAGPTSNTYNAANQLTQTSNYPQIVTGDSPAGYWRLGETTGTTAVDASGNGHNGTYQGGVGGYTQGATGAIAGDADTATTFDGVTGNVAIADAASLRLNGNFSVEFWAKQNSLSGTTPDILAKGNSATVGGGYEIYANSAGTLTFKRDNTTAASSTAALGTGYKHFAVTYDGTNLRWYVNGTLQTTTAKTYATNTDTSFMVLAASSFGHFANDTLDDIAVYNTNLDAAQTAAHHQAGAVGTTYTYDPAGNMTALVDLGGTVGYGYDAANNNCWILEGNTSTNTCATPPTGATTMTYDANNYRLVTAFPNGATMNTTPDNAGNQKSAIAKNPSASVLTSYSYTYANGTTDRQLRQTSVENDPLTANLPVTTTYTYDGADQLSQAAVGGGTTYHYAYDANANRCSTTSSTTCDAPATLTYNTTNQLTAGPSGSYTYNGAGDLTSSPQLTALGYSSFGQTTSITVPGTGTIAMAYTGTDSAQRSAVGTTNQYSNRLGLAATETAGAYTFYTRDANNNLIGQRTATTTGGATTNRYYLHDAIGSVVGLTDTTGNLADRYTYDPYGTTLTNTGTIPNPWTYASGYQDTTTGLTKYGTRYYKPTLGRWTQQDPIPGNNRYTYAGNDPVNKLDPSGYGACGAADLFLGYAAGAVTAPETLPFGPLIGSAAGCGLEIGANAAADYISNQINNINSFFGI